MKVDEGSSLDIGYDSLGDVRVASWEDLYSTPREGIGGRSLAGVAERRIQDVN